MKHFVMWVFTFAIFLMLPYIVWADETSSSLNPMASLDFASAADLAVSASEELRGESRRLDLMEGAWAWGLRAYFPRLSISASEDDRLSQTNSDSFIKNYSINIDQLIWDGGRISMSRKIEKVELDMAAQNLERMAREIGETAVSAYREVLFHRMVLDIREKAYVYLEEQRRILLRELELGMALPIDLAIADITIAEANIEIKSLKIDLSEAELRLAEMLGLEEPPMLSEKIDIYRSASLPNPESARLVAESGNPALLAARYAVIRREIEKKYASRSWMPTIRLTGSFSLSGQRYPLTKYNWSVGIMIEFSTPWVSGNLGGSAGMGTNDQNARIQSSATPLPDPVSAFSAKTAALNLNLEQINYANTFRLTGRMAEQAIEKCLLLDQKRVLALEAMELEAGRYRLAELKLELGRITRVELMDAMLLYAEREISAVRAAVSLLEAERELESFLDLPPGGLAIFADQ
ncbi:MAG: TolC family protein [Treponema sp.]|jgi:outer membrane protein TolC|nr:TolC family protein [Treponema sp.]